MIKRDLTLDLYVISRLTHIYYTEELRKLGISMGQFPFIMGICKNEGSSQERLSESLRISKSTTAVIIGQLIRSGLVERTVHDADHRMFRLSLTDAGRALIPHIEKVIQKCHAMILKDFSEGEQKILAELLQRARANSEENFSARSKGKNPLP